MPTELTAQSTVFALGDALDGRLVSDACDPGALVNRAIAHRVSAILARTPYGHALPASERARLDEDARLAALHTALIDDDLRALLEHLHARGLHPLVIKGAQFARSLYPSPHLRPRADSDLLIRATDRTAMSEALAGCGYTPSDATSGSLILGEFQMQRPLRAGVIHYVDVHWRVAAPLTFERAFNVAEIASHAGPIPGLGPHARGPAPAHALALACVHAVAHHWEQLLLLWLYDVRLLAETFDAGDRQRFIETAVDGGYTALAYCALKTTRLYFRSAAVDTLLNELSRRVKDDEPAAVLLRHGRRGVDDLLFDLRVADWRQRVQLLREHVLPPADYMRAHFGGPLPIAYALRFFKGVGRWF